jgi:enoyl-CoA hydratase/carnithine racemase
MTETLLRSRAGARLTLTLNRPQRLNALDLALWDALGDAALAAAADPELRVVIVTGAGGAFASGGDIEEFQRVRRTPAEARAYDARVVRAISALAACPHPVIAAINGDCVGGGLEIAASCDLRIAAASARFGIPVARLAMAAPPEAVEALVDLIGLDRALSLLLEARLIDAAEADRIGLVTRVVGDQDFAAGTEGDFVGNALTATADGPTFGELGVGGLDGPERRGGRSGGLGGIRERMGVGLIVGRG